MSGRLGDLDSVSDLYNSERSDWDKNPPHSKSKQGSIKEPSTLKGESLTAFRALCDKNVPVSVAAAALEWSVTGGKSGGYRKLVSKGIPVDASALTSYLEMHETSGHVRDILDSAQQSANSRLRSTANLHLADEFLADDGKDYVEL